jgi:hypothetical protein
VDANLVKDGMVLPGYGMRVECAKVLQEGLLYYHLNLPHMVESRLRKELVEGR